MRGVIVIVIPCSILAFYAAWVAGALLADAIDILALWWRLP